MTIEKYSMFIIDNGYILIDIKMYEMLLKAFRDDKSFKRKRIKGNDIYHDYVRDIFFINDNEIYMVLEKVYIKEDKMSTRTPE